MIGLKFKAGALQLTTFIIVVIALLLTAFILLVYTHRQFQIQSDFVIETIKLADRGVNYTLENSVRQNDSITINLDDKSYKNLKVYRNFWGVFEQIVSSAEIKNKHFQKIALLGSKQPKSNRNALYLQDNNKPLVLVGNTKIEGQVYLPQQGVKPGYIGGQSFYGSQLIYGSTRVASRLPKLSSEILNSTPQIESIYTTLSQNQFLNIEDGENYSNSFLEPLQMVFSNNEINLRNIQLTGHILVQSKSKIVVHPSSNLRDVILIAPKIEIRTNTKGNFQALASKEIFVGNNVQLSYPSALVVKEKQETQKQTNTNNLNEEEHKITIEQDVMVKGLILFLGEEKPNNYKSQILIKENATVYGELYNTQNTELQGTVYGTIFTNNFIANQSGSVYQNHIYNGTINVNELPQEYVGLLFNDSKKDVMKWLY